MKKRFKILLCSVLGILALTSCGAPDSSSSSSETKDTIVVTDLAQRKVTVKTDVQRVICLGAGALRLYSYVGDMNKLVGVENVEKSDSVIKLPKRPYQVLHQELFDSLPLCGTGGPKGQQLEKENILNCNPDVVFTTLKSFDALDDFTKLTDIPMVFINYGPNGGFELDPAKNGVKKSLELIGKVMNREARAKEINDYIADNAKYLSDKTKDIADADKKSVYLGALGNFGMHALDSSQDRYPLLNSINAKNVLDEIIPEDQHLPSESEISEEILNTLNPDVVLIDAGGIVKTRQQLADKEKAFGDIYRSWNAFKNDEVYVLLPYKVYYMQVENGIIDAIFAAKILFPEVFKDVDVNAKAKEVYTKFYGSDCYEAYLEAANLKGVALNKFQNE